MFGLPDASWLKKKLDAGKDSRDFQYTKGNCKHYGTKAADIFAGVAAICFLVPLVIDIFNKDSRDDSGHNNYGGRTVNRKH